MLRRQEKVYSKKKEEEVEFTVVPLAKVIILQNKKIESLGTLPTGVSRMGIGWVSGQELYIKSNGILICPKQEIWKADLENSKNRISMIPNLHLQGTV